MEYDVLVEVRQADLDVAFLQRRYEFANNIRGVTGHRERR
ncbi:hypothetical protein AS9A_1433 [Hoyosella subflava DQS3-9A1]|uniref:Uncharacterized protein n=1 Tax=Hoyosella subflava (strain DSM 45089 / JCM 17490 / NBRC 109087 / DQS3-9A1) TaxID=443218 RepID=F6EH48_HOYSD|nr:hypothetical protein AS9A_1433 [Hoyosella subflava DQS3-9A1]